MSKKLDVLKLTKKYKEDMEKIIKDIGKKDLNQAGYCPFCKKEIATFNKITKNASGGNEHYRDYWVLLNNNTKMRIPCCDECINKITNEMITEYMRKERNSQVYQVKESIKIPEHKKITAMTLVSSYEHIAHSKDEPELDKDKQNGQVNKTI